MFRLTKTTAFYPMLTVIVSILISGCGMFLLEYQIDPDWKKIEPKVTTQTLHDIWGSGPDDLFAVGNVGTIVHYDGEEWIKMETGTNYSALHGVWGGGKKDVFVVGENGTIKHYNGESWTEMETGTQAHLSAIWGTYSDNVFVVGASGTIIHFDGSSWHPMVTNTPKHLYDIFGTSTDNIFAVGDAGIILKYDGNKWLEFNSGSLEYLHTPQGFRSLHAVWSNNKNEVFATIKGGGVLHFTGTSWEIYRSWSQTTQLDICGTSSDNLLFVGWNGSISLHKGGDNWEYLAEGPAIWNFNAIWCAGPDEAFAVGSIGRIYHYKKGSASDSMAQ